MHVRRRNRSCAGSEQSGLQETPGLHAALTPTAPFSVYNLEVGVSLPLVASIKRAGGLRDHDTDQVSPYSSLNLPLCRMSGSSLRVLQA